MLVFSLGFRRRSCIVRLFWDFVVVVWMDLGWFVEGWGIRDRDELFSLSYFR